jgi:hypothetical protein
LQIFDAPTWRDLAYWLRMQQISNNAQLICNAISTGNADWKICRRRRKIVSLAAAPSTGGNARKRICVNAYVRALGGRARVTAIQLQDVERAVDLVLLAKTARAELAAGKATVNDVVKLENSADRAVRRLNLPPPSAAPVQTLQDYLGASDNRAEE